MKGLLHKSQEVKKTTGSTTGKEKNIKRLKDICPLLQTHPGLLRREFPSIPVLSRKRKQNSSDFFFSDKSDTRCWKEESSTIQTQPNERLWDKYHPVNLSLRAMLLYTLALNGQR